MKIIKYEVIDEKFPLDEGDYDVTAYHIKNIFIRKSIFNITLWIRWYTAHINSDNTNWYKVGDTGNYLRVSIIQEHKLNTKFLDDFDKYHLNRKSLSRDNAIDFILNE